MHLACAVPPCTVECTGFAVVRARASDDGIKNVASSDCLLCQIKVLTLNLLLLPEPPGIGNTPILEDVIPQPCPSPVCWCGAVNSLKSVGGAKAVATSLVPELCCNFQVWCFFPSVQALLSKCTSTRLFTQAVWGEQCFLFLRSLRGDACRGEQG